MPTGVRSAVRKATTYGWAHTVTIAIGPPPEGTRSVVMELTKGPTRLISRHEGDTNGERMSFSQAWRISQQTRGIYKIGWNELLSGLEGDGTAPRPSPTPKALKELQGARQAVLGGIPGAVAVAVVDPGPLCKSMVVPGVRCNRQAADGGTLCAGPCSPETDW